MHFGSIVSQLSGNPPTFLLPILQCSCEVLDCLVFIFYKCQKKKPKNQNTGLLTPRPSPQAGDVPGQPVLPGLTYHWPLFLEEKQHHSPCLSIADAVLPPLSVHWFSSSLQEFPALENSTTLASTKKPRRQMHKA